MTATSGSAATEAAARPQRRPATTASGGPGRSVGSDPLLAVKWTVLQSYLELGGSLNDVVVFSHPSLDVGPLPGGSNRCYLEKARGAYFFPLIVIYAPMLIQILKPALKQAPACGFGQFSKRLQNVSISNEHIFLGRGTYVTYWDKAQNQKSTSGRLVASWSCRIRLFLVESEPTRSFFFHP